MSLWGPILIHTTTNRQLSFLFKFLLSDKIKELLAPGIVDPDTVLVLVNAIYFKGNWDKQFNKEHTREKPFKVSKVNIVR